MVPRGAGAVVIEVSSHALALRRADHLRFARGVFTNLTRDHLDFHRDMEDYFEVKRRLFELLPETAFGVVEPGRSPRCRFRGRCAEDGDLRDRRRRGRPPRAARDLARGADLRRAHTARRRSICTRRSSAGRTSTTSSRPRRPRSRSTFRSARSKGASRLSPVFPAVSSSSPIPETRCASSSTTRTPTMR